jgi:ceramide glucosyltransferase
MPLSTVHLIEILLILGALAGTGYYLLCLWGAWRFLQDQKPLASKFMPPVSILKPLRGFDRELFRALSSHCRQDYPEFEIIFGVAEAGDPALEAVKQLRAEFPGVPMRTVVCPEKLGTNLKISSLIQMLPSARHEHVLVNDSDILVPQDYLARVMAPLADEHVGLVTCLYRGIAGPALGSKIEAVGIATDFTAGVLAAREVEHGIHFGLGSTLALRRRNLDAIGGFEVLADYLADDYELGVRLSKAGWRVHLADLVVDTFLPAYTFHEFFSHQLRWARSVRDSRRWGYVGMVLTFGLPWAMAALALAHGAVWAWEVLAFVFAIRLLMALVVGLSVARHRQVLRLLWLLPIRDLVAVVVWAASFLGHNITWRGDSFVLQKGKLSRVES